MINPILEQVIKNRNGHYCHAMEVCSAYEIECIIEGIAGEFPNATTEELKDFFNTMEVYATDPTNEDEVYNFSFDESIDDYLD